MSQSQFSNALSSIGWTFILITVVSILLASVSTILGVFVLLIGRFLGAWFEVRTFEAAVIVLGIAALFVYVFSRPKSNVFDSSEEDEDWDDDEDWDEEDEDDVIVPPRRRNDPCPCGSGDKYCHGRNV